MTIPHAKSCPFCGSNKLDMVSVLNKDCAVSCLSCEITGPYRLTSDEAINAWNHRPGEYRDNDFEPIMYGHWRD
jgi:Lar family restriction alleviation protein